MSVINHHNMLVKRKRGELFTPHPNHPRNMSVAPFWTGLDKELVRSNKHWYRTVIDPNYFKATCPQQIERRSAKELSLETFVEEYEKPGKPVIITDAIGAWSAMKNWTSEQLLKDYGDVKFRTGGGFRITLNNYFNYLKTQQEAVPLYLFDQNFAYNAKPMLSDYNIPDYFAEDLFKLVGEIERPPYRWILVGPPRSGAPFHIDPRGTSAWNAVIRGTKRWALYPPHVQPQGVGPDDSEYYDAPYPIKWYTEYYPFLKKEEMPLECLHGEGEVLFIPSGWWHQVYNLDNLTIAVTHNFASTANFSRVARDLVKDKDDFYELFKRKLKEQRKDLYDILQNMKKENKNNL